MRDIGTFDIIYADPPWSFGGEIMASGRADRHYPTMAIQDIKDLPVESIAAPDSLLFMWVTSLHLEQSMDVGRAWGFKYRAIAFNWVKDKTLLGAYTLPQTELCLVFKRGRIPKPRGARNVRQLCTAPRGRHSEKPFEIRDRIDAMFPSQSKIELFARTRHPGWEAWGNQIGDES